MNEYGFDQVMLSKLVGQLNRDYQLELTPTQFLEYPTLQSIVEYLLEEHQDVLVKQFQVEVPANLTASPENKSVPVIGQELLQEKTVNYFKKLLSAVIKLPAHRIETDAPMEKYGIDSIMVMQLTNELEKTFGSLSKTLFFEYQTIQELTEYFLKTYRGQLIKNLGLDGKPAAMAANNFVTPAGLITSNIRSSKHSRFGIIRSSFSEARISSSMNVAIIGVSGRYPQAGNIQEFWNNLRDGRDCITEIPQERWDHSLYFDADKNKPGKTYSKWGGFLDGVGQFDPLFFNISPVEAEIMDPQERLFLECVYETLEDAGYTRQSLGESRSSGANVGVYVGVMYEEYQLYGAQEQIWGRMIALSGNPASIANRVSYFFNFHGPSLAVDTMCSSSLTAIHLACRSLQRGECRLAIAGGVNVSIHPNKYLMLAQGRFASSKGRCESFGEGGDGYVPGEGVGAVLLKPLADAFADGDHIYGVIKGAAVNHGGKTNGYTVPNPNAQAEVIGQVLQEAGIDPRTISYIEAHGTGTSLGDPIEITGLTKAFREYTQDNQFCAIGSAKSNIGHCESAAGIAGVTKVLLQLKYGQLVPSIHSEVLNPNIDFLNSPFVVQRNLTEWKRPLVNGLELPRRAGVSSFGAGGSNAHIVIEEYLPKEIESQLAATTGPDGAIIVLSAKNEERLQEQVRQLLAVIQAERFSNADLADLAYTLQVGREAMEERLGFLVGSLQELAEKLQRFIEDQDSITELYRGQVKRNKEVLAVLTADEDMVKTIDTWIRKGKYEKLLDLWVKGLIFDWNRLYEGAKPRRISLPPYPFARESYWAPERNIKSRNITIPVAAALLHPLLHQNTSDLSEQRFSSTFTGEEFFLKDHQVRGQRILPGAASLEMARAAVIAALGVAASGVPEEGRSGNHNPPYTCTLKNIVWIRPVVVGEQPVRIHIGLYPKDNGEVVYEIYSLRDGGDGSTGDAEIVYSQGSAILTSAVETPVLDLKSLRAECSQGILSSSQLYDSFKAMGIDYGPAHRGLEMVYIGSGRVLAKLSIPAVVAGTQDHFILHPSIVDSALQASLGLAMGETGGPGLGNTGTETARKPSLPFALQELEILGRGASSGWALIQSGASASGLLDGDGSSTSMAVQKLDIAICDEQGKVWVRLKGYSSRILEGEITSGDVPQAASPDSYQESPVGINTLIPVWDVVSVTEAQLVPSPTDQVLIVGGTDANRSAIRRFYPQAHLLTIQSQDTIDTIVKEIEKDGLIDHLWWIAPDSPLSSLTEDILIDAQSQGVFQIFRMIKALLRLGYGSKDLGWTILTTQTQPIRKNDVINPTHASIYGLIGSLAKEYPNWKIRLLDLEAAEGEAWPIATILKLPADPQGNPLAYRSGEWYLQKLIPCRAFARDLGTAGKTLYKSNGVYIVIGGAGGIGEVWSEYMIRTYQARIVWIGRREPDETIQAKLDRLAGLGTAPLYITADATNRQALDQAYNQIKRHYSRIHGVIHSAIVLLDRSLANMDEEQFRAGFMAKAGISLRLAQVFGKEPLDFVMFFSSMQSFSKAPGQSNYASGCTFKDAFAHRLALEWPCPVKVMNWGYWGKVGSVASKKYRDLMSRAGVGSIEPPEAMDALEKLLAGPIDQMVFVKTTRPLEGIDPMAELFTVYPPALPSNIQSITNQIANTTLFNNVPTAAHSAAMTEKCGLLAKVVATNQEPQAGRFPIQVSVTPEKPTGSPMAMLEELSCRLLWGQLQSIGWSAPEVRSGEKLESAGLKMRIRDLYHRWLDESMAILVRHNYLGRDGKSYTVIDPTPIKLGAVWNEWEQNKDVWLNDPSLKAQVVLVEATLRALPEILTGKLPATAVLFPNSSLKSVEGIYKNEMVVDHFNEMIADIVAAYIAARLEQEPEHAKIRIIEIGAGTGGTSTAVFRKLQPYRAHLQEYCYTDISKAFLIHAATEYGPQNPYLTYQIFNVEAPVAGQSLDGGGYDLAIAANVLHATKNIRQTIRNAKAVLKNNGLLILKEISINSWFTHLTFGLLEGWWRYEDAGLRIPGCPGLYPETWEAVLAGEGFRQVAFPAQALHGLGQQIIVAESDGVVRQSRAGVRRPAFESPSPENRVVQKPLVTKTRGGIPDLVREKGTAYLKKLIGDTLKIPYHQIDAAESFEKYGIDSILVVQLTNTLSKVFDKVNSNLFFEYQTIDELIEHFLKTQQAQLLTLVGSANQKDGAELSGEANTQALPPLEYSTPAFRSSRRFLQFREPDISGAGSQVFRVQDVAIIGLAGRYPGADNIQEFWNHLQEGRNCVTEIPKDRWDWREYFHEERGKNGFIYTKWGGFIKEIDKFDPLFFHISPKEAENMDPQERLFLEVAYSSVEDAGYTPATLCDNRKIGVFVGIMNANYPTGVCYWSIANRISYLLNFQGPSMAVDTACSSSLTAIHLALESLYSGISECAIAGGVNLIVDPVQYLKLSAMTMLSPGDKCKSFGAGADGFVDSEGVGAIVLKPLAKAIAANDHIYGIIKGSMVNAGGKTNGYTVPNPNAQYQLIAGSLKRAGVPARTISYLEAHGTGTALGDPIEINGLTRAFEQDTQDKQFCAIGSVKSNIGHCESASGIAGVTKVLLQFKYGQLVPSLHAEALNPNIDFMNTPFVVQRNLTEWKRPVIGGQEIPRRAGVSSFGAGGSNAHIVFEEYLPISQGTTTNITSWDQAPKLIVLSAQNEERLREQVQRLMAELKERQFSNADLIDIAYTLQVGREAMEERLAMLVGSLQELVEKLRGFIDGKDDPDLYRGRFKNNPEMMNVFTSDEEMREAVDKWIQRGKYGKLLDLWVKGLVFDWHKLYEDHKPQRISLPAYPFAREKYWLPESAAKFKMFTNPAVAAIHPLLHQNTSDIDGLQFSSTFTGEEFFLKDHVVKGQRIMPGVVGLEMARAAIGKIIGGLENNQVGIRLKNVVWIQPVVIDSRPVRVNIGLYPENSAMFHGSVLEERQHGIAYEIYGESVNDSEPIVYSQGHGILTAVIESSSLALESVLSQDIQNTLSPTEVYEAFKAIGIEYGPGHQGIEKIHIGKDRILAKLSLPVTVLDTKDQFVLHPSIMDAALQAIIGFTGIDLNQEGKNPKPSVPFALQELEIIGKCTPQMWALIRTGATDETGTKLHAHPPVRKYDIDLCDEHGMIQVRIKGFSSRVFEGSVESKVPVMPGIMMLEPTWREPAIGRESLESDYTRHFVILCENNEVSPEIIATQMNWVRCLVLQSKQKDVAKRFQDYALQIFELIQEILKDKSAAKVLVQIVVAGQGEQQLFSGLSGLLKTAWLENPKLTGQLIEVEPGEDPAGIIAKLKENSCSPGEQLIRYQDGKRQVAGWSAVDVFGEEQIPWKDGGIYLITGGAGGLGLIFASEIARQVKDAVLILTGRSALDGEKQIKLDELAARGAKVAYRQVDVTQKKAVSDLIDNIRREFGKLDGIIHSAGVIKDNFIIKKTRTEFMEVLAPKVSGLVNLDVACKDIPLDFFVFFSSLSGRLGNPGQADYATANAFMEAYAGYRNRLAATNQRHGRTLSISWPLWQEGGMHVDRETEKMMFQNSGLIAMRTETGIQALYQSLASEKNRVIVVAGDLQRLRAGFLEQTKPAAEIDLPAGKAEHQSVPVIEPDLLQEKAINYFKTLLSSVLKLPAHRIDAEELLEKYGIDSIMVMQLTNELEKVFGSLSKTLFFEYQTIRELTGYFLKFHRHQLIELLKIEAKVASVIEDSGATAGTVVRARELPFSNRRRPRFGSYYSLIQPKKEATTLDVAIIGVSGRYPQAGNIQEFWNNLRDGRDCITEIPQERWDHSLYFDADKNKPGKTYSKWGGFLDGVGQFDPLFFNISPVEAEIMDPQERLFLECVYETLEDAGYTRQSLGESQSSEANVGVYVGVMYEEYQLYGAQEQIQGRMIALSGNPASIANRVSYFFNFHGPSLAVDTMCSSSLTAIHLACRSLQRGECRLAIAGGVNVSIHPNKYLLLAQGRFASSKGRCESFGEGGDGYVPGEGVGAVLLKPLADALADGDHIYGVIKGIAVNHGGKTNGYTVPNPNAQTGVIGQVLQEAGIDPRTISYIEAHGTGTSLGDPIEITGLTKAFREYTGDNQFCAIGSAKSNIGHCESAAGIAGVTKVLLQLQNKQLVPSLHSEVLNPNIDFRDTPFVVQQKLTEWKRPVINGRECPRRAGVSTFGAGGSNAHIVIEEYLPKETESQLAATTGPEVVIIVLSAKNEERLQEQARQLLAVIQAERFSNADLADLAYTLQVGREAMEERLGFLVGSLQELAEKLQRFIEDQDSITELYRGQVKRNKEVLAVLAADEDMVKTIDTWIRKGKYEKLLDLWVKGLIFDWNRLYEGAKPRRISLPPYPFARESYWAPERNIKSRNITIPVAAALLHPLLHQNTSDLSEQRFSSTFTGEEFFLKDHQVRGQRILPGAASLEMARAAVIAALGVAASGVPEGGRSGNHNPPYTCTLKNIVWIRPVVVGEQPVRIHIGLYPKDNGEVVYEIYSLRDGGDGSTGDAEIVYSQGSAILTSAVETPVLDLKSLRAECSQGILSSSQLYDSFKAMGIDYGPAHRGLEMVYIGSGRVLAKLSIPAVVAGTQDHFILHPSIVDSALQASLGLAMGETGGPGLGNTGTETARKPSLPFALQELEILGRGASSGWALIQSGASASGLLDGDGSSTSMAVQKLDIAICDEQGKVWVRLKGYSSRILEGRSRVVMYRKPLLRIVTKSRRWESTR